MGKRLGNLTKDNTKCMVKVNGIPLIDRVLGQLSHFPLSKVILVIGYKGEKLKEYLGFDYQGLPIQYIENSIFDKTNNIYSISSGTKYHQKSSQIQSAMYHPLEVPFSPKKVNRYCLSCHKWNFRYIE